MNDAPPLLGRPYIARGLPPPVTVSRGPRGAPARSFARSDRITTYLTPPMPSSLPRELDQLEYSSRSMVFPRDGDRILRAWGPPERPFVVAVDEAGSRWRIRAWGASPSEARAAATSMFSLDHPIAEFYRFVRAEPTLRGTERTFRGLRLPRDSGLYEGLVHAIVGQQLSVRAANTIKGRIFRATEAVIEVEGREVPRIPSPAELERLGESGLRAAGASGAKARSLRAIARLRQSDDLDDARFASLSADEAIERLDAMPGVGRWTAENALLRAIGRRDLFIAGDLGLRAALDRFGAVPRAAPEARARAWADRWYPGWGSYATLYLWRKLVLELSASTE